jgi:corrinoid protein of di/trimethylamine methyltransferase
MENIDRLVQLVMAGDAEDAAIQTQVVIAGELAAGETTVDDVIGSLTDGMRQIGDRFARLEIFLPEMMMAAEAMKAAMRELEPEIRKAGTDVASKGKVVIGTIEGDMHEIGKDIVGLMLQVQGFELYDLGFDVNALDFVRKAEEVEADIIGVSALMTTTMPGQRDVVNFLEEMGLRDKYHMIVGGAPVTEEWLEESGADSWGENAGVSVEILMRAMEKRSN